ncbi:MAG: MFS transporter, DHA1 family, tetracycline resistance protein [Rhodobacteraceae bacterium HLUCCO07]|nr:MAG: MFS transporter, DHA1 family, tetracycline resistance protein [Rhodobacteraceae bacterium HLUCCO07]
MPTARLSVLFIVLTVVIDAMGIGLIMPVMPALIAEVEGTSIAQAAIWGGVLSTAFAVMQFLFAPLIGALSDRFGRRPVLLISLVVMATDYVVMALAGSIWLLLAGRVVGGITAATHSTANAYMADISEPHEKAARFGLVGAGFGLGFVLGPVLGGLLAEFGTRAPFWAAAALALANAGLGALVLRETVSDAIRRPFRWSRANPFGALRSITAFPGLRPILAVYFLYQVAGMVYPAIWAYFTTLRFGWTEATIGLSLGIYGLFFGLVQGFGVRPAMARLGYRGTVIFALRIEFVALIMTAFIPSGTVLLMLIPVVALGAVGLPALQGAMSQAVADDAQGELQGVLTSANSMAMIIAPLTMTQSFAAFTREDTALYLPGAPFLLAAMLMALCLLLFTRGSVSSGR